MPEEPIDEAMKPNRGETGHHGHIAPAMGCDKNQRLAGFKYARRFLDHQEGIGYVLQGVSRQEEVDRVLSKRKTPRIRQHAVLARVSSQGQPILVQADHNRVRRL